MRLSGCYRNSVENQRVRSPEALLKEKKGNAEDGRNMNRDGEEVSVRRVEKAGEDVDVS